jgi:hypothetical protein
VDVGEEDLDVAAGVEELGDLDGWDEVAAVWTPCIFVLIISRVIADLGRMRCK